MKQLPFADHPMVRQAYARQCMLDIDHTRQWLLPLSPGPYRSPRDSGAIDYDAMPRDADTSSFNVASPWAGIGSGMRALSAENFVALGDGLHGSGNRPGWSGKDPRVCRQRGRNAEMTNRLTVAIALFYESNDTLT